MRNTGPAVSVRNKLSPQATDEVSIQCCITLDVHPPNSWISARSAMRIFSRCMPS